MMGRDGKTQPEIHARGIALDGDVDEGFSSEKAMISSSAPRSPFSSCPGWSRTGRCSPGRQLGMEARAQLDQGPDPPWISSRPRVGLVTRLRILKRVLFPAPFGPMMPTDSPSPTAKIEIPEGPEAGLGGGRGIEPAGHRSFQARIRRPDEAVALSEVLPPGCPVSSVVTSDHVRQAEFVVFEDPVAGEEDEQARRRRTRPTARPPAGFSTDHRRTKALDDADHRVEVHHPPGGSGDQMPRG